MREGVHQDTQSPDACEMGSPSHSQVFSISDLAETESVVDSEPISPCTPASTVHFADVWTDGVSTEDNSKSRASFSSKRSGRPLSTVSITFAGGTIMFTVEDTDFTVDRVLLKGLSARWTDAVRSAGDEPIELDGVKKADFELLIDILSNKGRFADAELTLEECTALLRISPAWPLDKLHTIAVDSLDNIVGTNSVRRIELGHAHGMEDWVDQGLGELCVRKEPPTLAEAPSLEKDELLFLGRVRPLAVATEKDNAHFHWRFPDLPQKERLLTWYRCAFRGSILLQGCMYLTKRHLCFHSRNFGQTLFTIPFVDIVSMEKRNTAKIFPNGIAVDTTDRQYIFVSFTSRDATLDLLWDLRRFV